MRPWTSRRQSPISRHMFAWQTSFRPGIAQQVLTPMPPAYWHRSIGRAGPEKRLPVSPSSVLVSPTSQRPHEMLEKLPQTDDLHYASLLEVSNLIATGEVSPVAVTEMML